jgi:hypothetical protein
MVLDEHELRQHLSAAADQASAPRFTIEALIGRTRRRRAKIFALVSGSLLAVAATAVAVPVVLSAPGAPPTAVASKPVFRLSFMLAVNGQSRPFPKNGSAPRFTVAPGEQLRIQVGVLVPAHAKVTTLWLGIDKDMIPPGRNGQRPLGMKPVLAHTRKLLTHGLHTFRLTLTMPAQLHREAFLVAAWTTKREDASVAQPVAELVAPR